MLIQTKTNIITYMRNLKKKKIDTNELIYKTERLIDLENKLMTIKEERARGRDEIRKLRLTDTHSVQFSSVAQSCPTL